MLVNIKGKGGRLRDCPILSKEAVEQIKNTPNGQNVWSKIPSRADIHSYRAEYCKSLYQLHARPIAEIPKDDKYYCRSDLKGVVYDKKAMLIASQALGHNRISVIAGHYLYGKDGVWDLNKPNHYIYSNRYFSRVSLDKRYLAPHEKERI